MRCTSEHMQVRPPGLLDRLRGPNTLEVYNIPVMSHTLPWETCTSSQWQGQDKPQPRLLSEFSGLVGR